MFWVWWGNFGFRIGFVQIKDWKNPKGKEDGLVKQLMTVAKRAQETTRQPLIHCLSLFYQVLKFLNNIRKHSPNPNPAMFRWLSRNSTAVPIHSLEHTSTLKWKCYVEVFHFLTITVNKKQNNYFKEHK